MAVPYNTTEISLFNKRVIKRIFIIIAPYLSLGEELDHILTHIVIKYYILNYLNSEYKKHKMALDTHNLSGTTHAVRAARLNINPERMHPAPAKVKVISQKKEERNVKPRRFNNVRASYISSKWHDKGGFLLTKCAGYK